MDARTQVRHDGVGELGAVIGPDSLDTYVMSGEEVQRLGQKQSTGARLRGNGGDATLSL